MRERVDTGTPGRPALRGVSVLLLAAPLLAAGVAAAQDFKDEAEVAAVLVPVTVRDAKGRLVSDLERKSFHLYVDGIQFPIKSFWHEGGLPLSLTFLLDTSGSMGRRRLGKASEAILELVRQFRRDDEACLITFGAGEVKRRLPFGTDPSLLTRILEPLSGYGTTALYDVLTITPRAMEGAKDIRRAILLFTDGVDTASQFSAADALKVVESLSDPIYVFGIEPPPPEAGAESYETLLTQFAEASGGRYLRVDDVAALPAAARALRGELTQRYIIAFEPSGVGTSKQRRIRVAVSGKFQVVTRQSYSGTLP
jgi:Ca-activated chloride channel family protein